ncbi:hypothetical protein MMC17_000890 [Xylographa soralifera]|nr:hypothetical protein [Xylographa soralifera]
MNESTAETRTPTYHNTDAAYTLPNDSTEHARLEDQAAGLLTLMHGQVIQTPLTNPSRILDVGCGTGVVTCALGSLFPHATVYGVDLSPVPARPTPPNVTFIQGDIRKLAGHDPRFAPASFDFVFNRLLVCGITDWPAYVRAVAGLLRPGGWAEMQDLNYAHYRNGRLCSADWAWMQAVYRGAAHKGLDVECGSHIRGYMEAAGLVDVRVREFRIPYGTWEAGERPETRHIGEHTARENWILYYHMIPRLVEGLGYEQEEVERLRSRVREDLGPEEGKDWVFYVTRGRKAEV